VATELLPGPPNANQQSRWETGTMNVEGAAGIEAAIEYIASLGVRYGGGKSWNTTDNQQNKTANSSVWFPRQKYGTTA
jgi:selenocysteine lyase/cysteine desulfurase